ncbi:ras-like protein family member 10B [Bacillus rossius redtenbacheri]|uniref:ras-like protein family member 10B n=1 Tax=Bacillus rossius redtenbacheri TaxID=93214 RepID=UPI002FDCAE67
MPTLQSTVATVDATANTLRRCGPLGPALGTAVAQVALQFIWNDFSDEYNQTERKRTYFPSVLINDHLYRLTIADLPVIPYFPSSPRREWADFRFCGLRGASAYVLVYDASNAGTFRHVRALRDQMCEARDMRGVPVVVVGNKRDLVACAAGTPGAAAGDCGSAERREIANLVKKQWKCCYVECSAKYNWRVVTVFRELMKIVDGIETGQGYKEVCSPMRDNFQEALDRNRCNII